MTRSDGSKKIYNQFVAFNRKMELGKLNHSCLFKGSCLRCSLNKENFGTFSINVCVMEKLQRFYFEV